MQPSTDEKPPVKKPKIGTSYDLKEDHTYEDPLIDGGNSSTGYLEVSCVNNNKFDHDHYYYYCVGVADKDRKRRLNRLKGGNKFREKIGENPCVSSRRTQQQSVECWKQLLCIQQIRNSS